MEKQSASYPSEERISELKGLGFVTALATADIPEERIGQLYEAYTQQDAMRSQALEAAYNTIVGK